MGESAQLSWYGSRQVVLIQQQKFQSIHPPGRRSRCGGSDEFGWNRTRQLVII